MKGFTSIPMLRAKTLNQCGNVWELANYLETDYETLSSLLYSPKKRYRLFFIKKKSGGQRTINAPVNELKAFQHKINSELGKYYRPRKCTHGFIQGKSILSNAKEHTKKEYVLNIDLKDFFPSITFGRVKRLFESHPLKLNHPVATVLSHICCHNGNLPQGAPSSPIISNMIAYKLDRELSALAKTYNCSYSRYADDITFSFTHMNSIPSNIVSKKESREVVIGKSLRQIIKRNGFEINDEKTRLQHRTQHQEVTGLTVNEKVNINRKFIRTTSSMIYALYKHGAVDAENEHFDTYYKSYIPERQLIRMAKEPGNLFIRKVKGRMNYIRMVRGASCRVYRKLMYSFTTALGEPNEKYAKDWLDVIAESTFVINTYLDDNQSQGSGFILKNIGIITNQHVIDGISHENIHNVEIFKWNNSASIFKLITFIKSDSKSDIAILDPGLHLGSFKPLEANDNADYSTGKTVYTIGYPNHKEGEPPTILEMKIKGSTQVGGQKRIKVDKNIQHGSSGGVVIDTDGKVVGLIANGNAVASKTTHDSTFIPIEAVLSYSSDA